MVTRLLTLVLVLALSFAEAGEEATGGIEWRPQHNKQCSKDFTTFADKTVTECESLCSQIDGCSEFSSPIPEHINGCRIAKGKAGCAPSDGDANLYKAVMVTENESMPDEEGPGASRRRRSDSRRRTHMPIKTKTSQTIAALKKQETDEQQADAAAQQVDEHLKLENAKIVEEMEYKKKYKQLQTNLKIKEIIEKADSANSGPSKASVSKVEDVQIKALKKQISSAQAQIPVISKKITALMGAYDVAVIDAQRVVSKVKMAEKAIETMMLDPGVMADQDRQIGIAILGKLRVTGALVTGDLPSLDADQHEHEYLVHMREAMLKAVRNPSDANLLNAKVAYKTATNIMNQAKLATVKATEDEAKALALKTKEQKREQALADASGQATDERTSEALNIAAEKTKANIAKSAVEASGDPTAVPPEVILPKPPKPPSAKPGLVELQRSFYDPPAAGETELGSSIHPALATYHPSTDLPGDFE